MVRTHRALCVYLIFIDCVCRYNLWLTVNDLHTFIAVGVICGWLLVAILLNRFQCSLAIPQRVLCHVISTYVPATQVLRA